jgi:hypothetical protein
VPWHCVIYFAGQCSRNGVSKGVVALRHIAGQCSRNGVSKALLTVVFVFFSNHSKASFISSLWA